MEKKRNNDRLRETLREDLSLAGYRPSDVSRIAMQKYPTVDLYHETHTPLSFSGSASTEGSCRQQPVVGPLKVDAFSMPAFRSDSGCGPKSALDLTMEEGSCRLTPVITPTYVQAFPMPAFRSSG